MQFPFNVWTDWVPYNSGSWERCARENERGQQTCTCLSSVMSFIRVFVRWQQSIRETSEQLCSIRIRTQARAAAAVITEPNRAEPSRGRTHTHTRTGTGQICIHRNQTKWAAFGYNRFSSRDSSYSSDLKVRHLMCFCHDLCFYMRSWGVCSWR